METVMLSGSRNVKGLPETVSERLRALMERKARFLVGDAYGADRAFQQSLKAVRYDEVEVFTSLDVPRTNLGQWSVQRIDTGLRGKSAALHTVKDRHMVLKADCGLVMWDGESTGSLANIIDFINAQKSCHVWILGDEFLSEFNSPSQLEKLLSTYPSPAREARKRLATFHNRERRRTSQSVGSEPLF